MKISFLIRSLHYGGAERQLVLLAPKLVECGHIVNVLTFYAHGELEQELVQSGVPVIHLEKAGRWDTLGFLLRLMRRLRRDRPDVLHGYLAVPNLLALLLKPVTRVKVVWGIRAAFMDWKRFGWLEGALFRLSCFASRFANLILVNSDESKRHHARCGFHEERMRVVHNGFDTSRFRPEAAERSRVRREWGLDDSHVLIGIAARLDPMKDHANFLRAAAAVAREREDVRFVCIGDGPAAFASQLRELAAAEGHGPGLIWAGARADMPAVYGALDLAVLSSYGESFPNVLAEAMACGTPCVTTDVGDAARIVGDVGEIVPARDPAALARGMQRLLARLEREGGALGRRARERIEERFSVEALVRKTCRELETL